MLFHRLGPTTAKELSPPVFSLDLGTFRKVPEEDLRTQVGVWTCIRSTKYGVFMFLIIRSVPAKLIDYRYVKWLKLINHMCDNRSKFALKASKEISCKLTKTISPQGLLTTPGPLSTPVGLHQSGEIVQLSRRWLTS